MQVYQAKRHTTNGTIVAIKTAKRRRDSVSIDHELSVASSIGSHPNLMAFQDTVVTHDDDTMAVVMPILAGGTFRDRTEDWLQAIGSHPTETLHQLLRAYQQALCGLAHLHAQGYTHLDIKGENLLLDDQGRVVICDFGMSCR